jgi:hypothetical protein
MCPTLTRRPVPYELSAGISAECSAVVVSFTAWLSMTRGLFIHGESTLMHVQDLVVSAQLAQIIY